MDKQIHSIHRIIWRCDQGNFESEISLKITRQIPIARIENKFWSLIMDKVLVKLLSDFVQRV